MKKLLLSFALLFLFSFASNAQTTTAKKYKISCITTSCCGIGPFGIEIWSETTCVYVSAGRSIGGEKTYSMSFQSNEKVSKVTVKEDVILAGQYNDNGENLVLPSGTYDVVDSEVIFVPTTLTAKKYCYIRETHGTIFGHDYDYTISICVSFGKTSKGFVTLTPKLTDEQKAELLKNGNQIEFAKDMEISENGINYVVKAGKYFVNEDGNAYVQNALLF